MHLETYFILILCWYLRFYQKLEPRGFFFFLQYYYEPRTGRKFRSLSSVDRHLADLNQNTTLPKTLAELREYSMPVSKAFKIGSHVKVRASIF